MTYEDHESGIQNSRPTRASDADRDEGRRNPALPSLERNHVHVWVARATAGDACLLAPDEVTRAERIRVPASRRRFVAGRSLVRRLLGAYVGTTAESLRFEYGRSGKPFLPDKAFHFNLSHSGEILVCAVAGYPVGVDVEGRDSIGDVHDLPDRMLSPGEERWIESLGSDEKLEALLRVWVRKEAVVKGIGVGLGMPLPTIETPRSLEAVGSGVRVRCRPRQRWFVWDITGPEWAATVAAPTPRSKLIVLQWRDGGASIGEVLP